MSPTDIEEPIFEEVDHDSDNRNCKVVFNKFVYEPVYPYGTKASNASFILDVKVGDDSVEKVT